MTYAQKVKSTLKKELSPKQYYSQFKSKYDHILLGGSSDALTTLVALWLFSMNELNPLINHLLPEHVYLVPCVLVEMAFIRFLVVSAIFKKSKYANWAVYFTLYFLPIWNTLNIFFAMFYAV